MPKNIKRLEIKNCLGITELEIQAGKVNIISGGNEKGKTSVLEVIEKGLQNTQRRTKFVRDGADEATLYIEMDDDTTISRKEKADGKSSVRITQAGASISKPETYLKTLVGEGFGFNPVDFMSRKDKEQTQILLSLMPMRVTEADLQEWFGEAPVVNLNQHAIDVLGYLAEKYYYDRRAIANGAVKECQSEIKALFEQLPDNYNGNDWREVNIGALYGAVQEAIKTNSFREQAQALINTLDDKLPAINYRFDLMDKEQADLLEFKIEKARKSVEADKQIIRDEIADRQHDIKALEAEIVKWEEMIAANRRSIEGHHINIGNCEEKLSVVDTRVLATKIESLQNEHAIELKNIEEKRQAEIAAARDQAGRAQTYLETKPQIDVLPLQVEAEHAEKMKGFISLYDNLCDLQEALATKQEIASRLDLCVETARKKPAELLQQLEMPIKGLGINDRMQITIDGLPITNLSTSRQIKLALDIARATAGPLKLISIDRFESLDKEQQAAFFKEIEDDGYQYFISTVTDGDLKVEAQGVA